MAGYNYQIGNVILGIQGEYNYADIAGSEVNIFTNIHTARLRNFGSVDGRLGLAFLGNTMLYGIGGVAFGDIKQKFSGPTGTPSTSYSGGDRVGWDLGAGIEVAFGHGWTGRIDYRHYEFGAVTVQPDGVILGDAHSQKMMIDTARIGIAYKFGNN